MAFVTAAVVMVLLMFSLSLLIATAQEQIVGALRANVTQVKRWGGVILMFIGLWLIALGIWAKAFAQIFPV
jgi:hypothetical protein